MAHVDHDEITESDLLTMELYLEREGNVSPEMARTLIRAAREHITPAPRSTAANRGAIPLNARRFGAY